MKVLDLIASRQEVYTIADDMRANGAARLLARQNRKHVEDDRAMLNHSGHGVKEAALATSHRLLPSITQFVSGL